MPEFLQLADPQIALREFLTGIHPSKSAGFLLPVVEAIGRVTSEPVYSPEQSPAFSRSTVDGLAVRARDTFGASDGIPVYLSIKGQIRMGNEPGFGIDSGQAAEIHTGGMIPEGCDAVIMLENSQALPNGQIEIIKPVSPGENVIQAGEDVRENDEIIPAGRIIRSVEIGGMLAVGISSVLVKNKPRVGILSSGDELVPPQSIPALGQVRDINSSMIANLVAQNRGKPILYDLMPDDPQSIRKALQKAFEECDAMVITAGSSASTRDYTAQAIQSLGNPGILFHGLNIKPGKPTILAICGEKPVIGLPGNPVSALVIATLYVIPMVKKLTGIVEITSSPTGRAKLNINLPSVAGRVDYWPVKINFHKGEIIAEPVFYKSNLIFSLVKADALAVVPASANGLSAGEEIEYTLLE
jgi:molybdopterin molybdotransferase